MLTLLTFLVAAIFVFLLIFAVSSSIGKGVKSMFPPPANERIAQQRYRQGDQRSRAILMATGLFLAAFWVLNTLFGPL